MIGQQDALAYGVGRRNQTYAWRTDMGDVCGKHPAVYGWDIGDLGLSGHNLDGVDFTFMRRWMQEVHKRGGINTISWHMRNPLTGGDAWDTGHRVVRTILPGGNRHPYYLRRLDDFADYVRSLRQPGGELLIPLVFRPFHEHTGSWFWWGRKYCEPEEFTALWQFTVQYLRQEKGLDNLLYAYSPDIIKDKAHYLESYPGDDYVDVFGLDDYHDLGRKGKPTDLIRRLRIIVELADERGKVAALTETGYENIPQKNWWTSRFLRDLFADPVASRIAWVLLWRNDRSSHHYGPYPGHISERDFVAISQDERIGFLT